MLDAHICFVAHSLSWYYFRTAFTGWVLSSQTIDYLKQEVLPLLNPGEGGAGVGEGVQLFLDIAIR